MAGIADRPHSAIELASEAPEEAPSDELSVAGLETGGPTTGDASESDGKPQAVAEKVAKWKAGSGSRFQAAGAKPAATKDGKTDTKKRLRSAGPKQVTIGNKLGGFEVKRRLGDERSTVFLAKAPNAIEVALKILPGPVIAASPTVGKRFLRAARSLFGLRHDNVVAYLDAGEELGNYYVAMERLEGQSLKDLLGSVGGKLPEGDVLKIATGITP